MKKTISRFALAAAIAYGACALPSHAHGQHDASMTLSALPVASVVLSTAAVGAAASTAVVLPVALSVAGSQLVIKSVQASADGVVYLLERLSDGAQCSVRVSHSAAHYAIKQVDTAVSVVAISSGVILLAAGEVLAFVPNELGRALLRSEKISG